MTVSDDLAVLVEAALAGAAANAGPSDVSTGDYASRVEQAAKGVEAEIARLEECAQFAGVPAWTKLWLEKEAAEAEVVRLRDGLRALDKLDGAHPAFTAGMGHGWKEIARALLADDGAAQRAWAEREEAIDRLAEDCRAR